MENNSITEINDISSKAKSFREALLKLIHQHSDWHGKSRNEAESEFHDSLQRALNLSEWITNYIPGKDELKIESYVQQLVIELRNITKMCDKLADQYIAEKNRKETATISRFKETAQYYYLILNKLKIV